MIEALIINLDEVLIATSFKDAYFSANIRVLQHQFDGREERFILRPNARQFLASCRSISKKIYLVSRTPMERVLSIIATAGIASCFDNVFGEEMLDYTAGDLLLGENPSVEGLVLEGEYALIDSRDWKDDSVRINLSFFGADVSSVIRREKAGEEIDEEENEISNRLIVVDPYYGYPDDCWLLDVLWGFEEAMKRNENDNEGDCCEKEKRTVAN